LEVVLLCHLDLASCELSFKSSVIENVCVMLTRMLLLLACCEDDAAPPD